MAQAIFKLVKPARKMGGDKYECSNPSMSIYFPQQISRKTGAPTAFIACEFFTKEDLDAANAAEEMGG